MQDEVLVLAVVGMPATGKSEVIKKLKVDFDFFHLYYGDITFDEVKRRGLELNEVNERLVREDFRASGDLGIYSRFILPKIQQAIAEGHTKILLESMYNVFEYEIIKETFPNNFKVLAIHSDEEIRLKRIGSRSDRRLTKEEMDSRQISEAKKLGKGAVIALADFHLINNSNSMEVFEHDLNLLLNRIGINKTNSTKPFDYDSWNFYKKSANLSVNTREIYFDEREIWFCSIGLNIGSEQNGHHELFERPILILRKFNKDIFLGLPLTSKKKTGKYYFPLTGEVDSSAVLTQIRLFDRKRLQRKVRVVSLEEFELLKKATINIFN
jgi:dephospho-CoA kinase/mRNA-degrading endonuclease toxin of MazEF toxin-antitoxin module